MLIVVRGLDMHFTIRKDVLVAAHQQSIVTYISCFCEEKCGIQCQNKQKQQRNEQELGHSLKFGMLPYGNQLMGGILSFAAPRTTVQERTKDESAPELSGDGSRRIITPLLHLLYSGLSISNELEAV
jgi:hypothetical protein